MALFVPFRRIWGANWFVPIAAIGTKIPERHYLTDPAMDFTPTRNRATLALRQRRRIPCRPHRRCLVHRLGLLLPEQHRRPGQSARDRTGREHPRGVAPATHAVHL